MTARRGAARRRDPGDGGTGLRRHPRLRPDRDLRPGRRSAPGRRSGTTLDLSEKRAGSRRARACAIRCSTGLMVVDPETLEPVPRDGETMGEIIMRGNNVMMGYLKNPTATAKAFARRLVPLRRSRGHATPTAISRSRTAPRTSSSPAARTFPRSRSKACSTGIRPCWRPRSWRGRTRSGARRPCAFVGLKPGAAVTEQELIEFCRANMAHFKAPKTVVFGPLPKTSTGKIQKFVLREKAKAL